MRYGLHISCFSAPDKAVSLCSIVSMSLLGNENWSIVDIHSVEFDTPWIKVSLDETKDKAATNSKQLLPLTVLVSNKLFINCRVWLGLFVHKLDRVCSVVGCLTLGQAKLVFVAHSEPSQQIIKKPPAFAVSAQLTALE